MVLGVIVVDDPDESVVVVVTDSVTELDSSARGAVAVSGSHGGVFSARMAAVAGVRGVIFSDAGRGMQDAGVAGLAWLDEYGIAASAVGADTARIGNGPDLFSHGVTTVRNEAAARLGIEPGMTCRAAAGAMTRNGRPRAFAIPQHRESRILVADGPAAVWVLDSASLVTPADDGAVLALGSHGGLPGGDPQRALNCTPALAVFNDAGVGKDLAGIGRLSPLGRRGIPAATVSAATARIGDGLSTLEDGVISHVNEAAANLGVAPGIPLRDLIGRLLRTGTTNFSEECTHD